MTTTRSVVITGSAGAIGSASVTAFLDRGVAVIGLDRQAPAELPGGDYHHVLVDVSDAAATGLAVQEAVGGLPPIAHLVGIAGGALPEESKTRDDPTEMDTDLFRASLDANLVSQFIAMQAVLPHLLSTGGEENRSITFTSSFNALSAQGMPAYSAAKAGIVGLMYGLVRPLGRAGVRVNVVAPGTVRTPRTERLWSNVPGHFERLEAGSALGRLATAEEVAATFAAVALDLTALTGQVVVVDAGQTAVHL